MIDTIAAWHDSIPPQSVDGVAFTSDDFFIDYCGVTIDLKFAGTVVKIKVVEQGEGERGIYLVEPHLRVGDWILAWDDNTAKMRRPFPAARFYRIAKKSGCGALTVEQSTASKWLVPRNVIGKVVKVGENQDGEGI